MCLAEFAHACGASSASRVTPLAHDVLYCSDFRAKLYSSPVMGVGSLAGFYVLGHQKERGTVRMV